MKQPAPIDIGARMDEAVYCLQVAREDLDTAHFTFDAGQFRGANYRAKHSIFHTISAVFAWKGIAFKCHKDMLSYFNKNYISTELFPRELGKGL